MRQAGHAACHRRGIELSDPSGHRPLMKTATFIAIVFYAWIGGFLASDPGPAEPLVSAPPDSAGVFSVQPVRPAEPGKRAAATRMPS